MPEAKRQPRNIALFVPKACVGHEVGEDGSVKLLVPRFRARWMQWLQKRLKKPHIKIQLDEIGSAVWLQIDGARNVAQIGEALEQHFGEKIHPTAERLGFFLGSLRRNRFIDLIEPGVPPEPIG